MWWVMCVQGDWLWVGDSILLVHECISLSINCFGNDAEQIRVVLMDLMGFEVEN